jgi:hypothetical protein
MLTFDEPTHTYRWKGAVVPSVTQLLHHLYSFAHVSPEQMEAAQLRGSDVHLMCQYHDEDRLDIDQFTPEVRAYLPAWVRFLHENRPIWTHIEQPLYQPLFGYAGTPDRVGVLEGWKLAEPAPFDIKSGAEHPLHDLQLAGYAGLVPALPVGPLTSARRFTIYLRPNGTYKLHEHTSPKDWPTFLSLATINHWTRTHLK